MIGLAAFVAALVALGALSAWHLWRMSALSERIISENYDSVVAAEEMKESLERQDSAGLFALLDRWNRALPQLQQHRSRFDAAYHLEMGVHLLLEGAAGPLSPKQQEIVAMCRDDAMRLDVLVKDLLDLSRIESGRVPPQLLPVEPELLLHGAVEPLRRQAEAKGVTLQVITGGELPRIAADLSQIERVISNLVTNAIRATPDGGTIEVAATRREAYVAISVRDNGRGIPEEYVTRIFEPFVQAPNAPAGGAGLGLSIVRRIVEAHAGQISVRSEPGRGTTFTFTIPVSAGAAPAASIG